MKAAIGITAWLLCCGCEGVSWTNPHIVESLRVLGVRAEPPTLSPGKSSELSVICADGSRGLTENPACDVEIAWFADCNNPDRNDPRKCFGRYIDRADALASPLTDTAADVPFEGFHFGPGFSFTAPNDILAEAVALANNVLHYGTSYVFFAVCAGQLYPVTGAVDRLPVECRDRNSGKLLDQRRFVVGYTTLYSYDLITSQNPVLQMPVFDGVAIPGSWASATDCPAGFAWSADNQCMPVVETCSKTNPQGCKTHCLEFGLNLASFSLFGADGTMLAAPLKSLWLDYFTNAGKVPDDAQFALHPIDISDSAVLAGMSCVNWQAPAVPTEEAHLWAVVRDNRGGLTVWDQRIVVR